MTLAGISVALCFLALGARAVVVNVTGVMVEIATQGPSSFRFSVGPNHEQVASTYLDPDASNAASKVVTNGAWTGLQASFGSISINTETSAFKLEDAGGNTVASSSSLFPSSDLVDSVSCSRVWTGYDASDPVRVDNNPAQNVASRDACCAACNADSQCNVFIWASSNPSQGDNCWLLKSSGALFQSADRDAGGDVPTPPPQPQVSSLTIDTQSSSHFYGSGSSPDTATTLARTTGYAKVVNRESDVPYFWSSDGYSALIVGSNVTENGGWDLVGQQVVIANAFDVYFSLAQGVDDSTAALFNLTGVPPVPPRWAMGFFASRWGWANATYINDTMLAFRGQNSLGLQFPIDVMISDFGWFTKEPDYSFGPTGEPWYEDFGWNNETWPSPDMEVPYFSKQLNVRFMGIRKPRVGNTATIAMAKSKGWLLPNAGYNGRNLNYSIAAVRDWYAQQQQHYLKQGVVAFWNDEGEQYDEQFFHWNEAQVETLNAFDSTKRFFSINRAFSVGMSRFGGCVWTGDTSVGYDDLQRTPGYLLNWGLAGQSLVTSDSGGFGGTTDPTILTRWLQVSAFGSIMRVHSTISAVPHFPFLFGMQFGVAMQKALNLRYQLVPYLYTLPHEVTQTGRLITRPLISEFPIDDVTATMTSQWLVGRLMPAPVLNQDASVNVYLPDSSTTWFEFNSTTTHTGGQNLSLSSVPLGTIPVYVYSPAIVPLAPVIQYTDALPGGPLEVQIYDGGDTTFTLKEDDGESNSYMQGNIRETTFTWKQASKTLSWTVNNAHVSHSTDFTNVYATLFSSGSSSPQQSKTMSLGTSGSIKF